MKINPGNARGLLVPQGDRPFSFVVYSSEIRDFGRFKRQVFFDEYDLHPFNRQSVDDCKKVLEVSTQSVHTMNNDRITSTNKLK